MRCYQCRYKVYSGFYCLCSKRVSLLVHFLVTNSCTSVTPGAGWSYAYSGVGLGGFRMADF